MKKIKSPDSKLSATLFSKETKSEEREKRERKRENLTSSRRILIILSLVINIKRVRGKYSSSKKR